MKQRPSHISTRSRIILVAIVAIIVPTVLLSLFGFRLIREQQNFGEERLVKMLRTAAEVTADSVAQRVEALENDLIEDMPLGDPEALEARLAAIEEGADLAEQVFLISSDGELVYPKLELPAFTPPRAALPVADDTMSQGFITEGFQKEFVANDLPGALNAYDAYKKLVLEWYEKESTSELDTGAGGKAERRDLKGAVEAARAIQLVASCLFKMENYEQAMEEYQPLAYTPVYQEAAFDLNVLARYQIGRALSKLGRPAEAAGKFLDLYEALLTTRPRAGEGPPIEYFKKRVTDDLDAFQAGGVGGGGDLSEAARARYEMLKRQDMRLRQRREFLESVQRWWQFKRQLMSSEPSAEGALQHISGQEFGMETSLVSFTRVKPRSEDTDYSLLGFKVNLNYVIENIAAPRFREAEFQATANVAVVDETGRAIHGGSVAKGSHDVVVGFPKPFHFWKIHVAEKDPQLARKMARKLTIVYTILNLMIVGVIVAGVYLTIKDMNRELELSKMKSDFVSNVSHELKTPLALIRMFSETLLMGRVKDNGRRQEYYDVITRESERLTSLINNVLDFSKIDAGRRTYEMEPALVEEVIRNTLGAYRYDLSRENFEVEVKIEPNLPEVVMDDDAISQALLNLLNNAVKYSGDRKEIKVHARSVDGALRISVTDSGIGIDREAQKKIFDMFYRGSDENVRSVRGTGLGLAITKHTAEAHGGTVLVESAVGQGSTFTIVLPLRQRTEETRA